MGGGRFLAVFSRADDAAKPDPTAYARERLTALVESAADDDAKARCETIIDAEGNGSGCVPAPRAPVDPRHGFHIPVVRFATAAHPRIPADPRPPFLPVPLRSIAFEAPDPATRRQRVPKVTTHEGEGTRVYCVARSAIKRTAKLGGILQWMGVSNDMTARISSAKRRRHHRDALPSHDGASALDQGEQGAQRAQGDAKRREGSLRRRERLGEAARRGVSSRGASSRGVVALGRFHTRASRFALRRYRSRASLRRFEGARARSRVFRTRRRARSRVLRTRDGPAPKTVGRATVFARHRGIVVFRHRRRQERPRARGDERRVRSRGETLRGRAEDGAVVFGDDPTTVPDAVAAVDVPPRAYYVGRVAEDVADVDFRRFAKETETKEVAVKEPTDSAA